MLIKINIRKEIPNGSTDAEALAIRKELREQALAELVEKATPHLIFSMYTPVSGPNLLAPIIGEVELEFIVKDPKQGFRLSKGDE